MKICGNILEDVVKRVTRYVMSENPEKLTIMENKAKNMAIKIEDKLISLYGVSRSIQGEFLTSEQLESLWGRTFVDWIYLRNSFAYLYKYLFEKEKLEFVLDNLSDDLSRKIFCDFIALNIVHVFTGVNYLVSDSAFKKIDSFFDILGIKNKKIVDRYTKLFNDSPKRPYEKDNRFMVVSVPDIGEIVVNSVNSGTAVSVIQTFYLKQYYHTKVMLNKGDVVFDIGAFDGITALDFAVSGAEIVYAFEPNEIMTALIELTAKYNNMSSKIKVIPLAVGEKSGTINFIQRAGSGGGNFTTETTEDFGRKIPVISLDDFIQQNRIPKIDFIKLDIEGSELQALKGGRETLKRFHPKLAVSIYHRPDDPYEILKFLIELGYKEFYLNHKWQATSDVVLFAI